MLERGKTVEVNGMRIHRYNDSIEVTDLTNAGKKGKVCKTFSNGAFDSGCAFEDLLDTLDTETFESLRAKTMDLDNEHGFSFHESERKGVLVAPAGFKDLMIIGNYVSVRADFDSFAVRDLVDQNNLPTLIPPCHGGEKKAIKAFYKWVAANQEAIKDMKFGQVWEAIRVAGVDTHYFCAMD